MNNNQMDLEEAKKLNQQSKQGNSASFTNTTGFDSQGTQEARQLNSQFSGGSSSFTSSVSGINNSDLEEAKKLNQQSRQNKGK
jgi:hypothetical protein